MVGLLDILSGLAIGNVMPGAPAASNTPDAAAKAALAARAAANAAASGQGLPGQAPVPQQRPQVTPPPQPPQTALPAPAQQGNALPSSRWRGPNQDRFPMAGPQSSGGGGIGGLGDIGSILAALGPAIAMIDPRNGSLGAGLLQVQQGRQKDAQQRAQQNQTIQWLQSQGLSPDEAAIIGSDPSIFRAWYGERINGKGDAFKQRAAAAAQYGLDPTSVEGRNYILTGDLPSARGGAAELGLNPQTGVDEQGNPVLIQIGKDGKAVKTALPEGVTLSKQPIKLDAGTHYVLLDPITRQPVGTIPKDLAGAEEQKVVGKGQGEAVEAYRSIASKMPGLEKVVSELDKLANDATYTLGGQGIDWLARQGGITTDGALARTKYQAAVSNQILPLLRDTFGAQFTAREGDTLMATLGDPDKSPTEKQAVLKAFIEQKRRDVEALGSRSGETGGAPPSSPPAGGVVDYQTYFGGGQ